MTFHCQLLEFCVDYSAVTGPVENSNVVALLVQMLLLVSLACSLYISCSPSVTHAGAALDIFFIFWLTSISCNAAYVIQALLSVSIGGTVFSLLQLCRFGLLP